MAIATERPAFKKLVFLGNSLVDLRLGKSHQMEENSAVKSLNISAISTKSWHHPLRDSSSKGERSGLAIQLGQKPF